MTAGPNHSKSHSASRTPAPARLTNNCQIIGLVVVLQPLKPKVAVA